MGFLSPKVSNLHCSFNRTYYYHYVKKVVDSQVFLNQKFSYIKKKKAAARKKSNQAVTKIERFLNIDPKQLESNGRSSNVVA
jgi:hypothetical protein